MSARDDARERLLARYRDETTPPFEGAAAVRCTDHGRFLLWCSPPAPPCRVACPPECASAPEDDAAVLRALPALLAAARKIVEAES